jgi:hypothetical protein
LAARSASEVLWRVTALPKLSENSDISEAILDPLPVTECTHSISPHGLFPEVPVVNKKPIMTIQRLGVLKSRGNCDFFWAMVTWNCKHCDQPSKN